MIEQPSAEYYEVLMLSPNADREMIDRAYRLLARRYHPDSGNGNAKNFDQLTKAYRILCNFKDRKDHADSDWKASHSPEATPIDNFTMGMEDDEKVSHSILFLLYIARRRDVANGGIGSVSLERTLGVPENKLEFHLWYLKEKGWIGRVDTGGYAITAAGVDAVSEKKLATQRHLLLPAFAQAPNNNKNSED